VDFLKYANQTFETTRTYYMMGQIGSSSVYRNVNRLELSMAKNITLEGQFSLDTSPTTEELNRIRTNLINHTQSQTHMLFNEPGIEINLVLKNTKNEIPGGIIASTMRQGMHPEVLWVAEQFRKQGYGRELVLASERIGYEKGCVTSHTWTSEFQGPQLDPKLDYTLIAVDDGYPHNLKEYVVKKGLSNQPVPFEKNG
jgi:hypothetical protein